MKVDIWSDVVCPFCYIGKRKFENALNEFSGKRDVEVKWHSFQLDPDAKPANGLKIYQVLAERKGMSVLQAKQMTKHVSAVAAEVGLPFNFDIAITANTFNAHRLLHLALAYTVQNELKEKLMEAYFILGLDIGADDILVGLGEKQGIPTAEIVDLLAGDRFKEEVSADQESARQLGVQGVPFFVFGGKYAVSGAQSSEIFKEVLEKIAEEEVSDVPTEAESINQSDFCKPEGC